MAKRFLGGLSLSNFMDTHQEWHAFVEGFSEGFCPFAQEHRPSPELQADIESEHHYYAAGRGFGAGAFVLLVAGMVILTVKVIVGGI